MGKKRTGFLPERISDEGKMNDLHTHILPGFDDGADTVETSLAMLREEYAQGVDTVALTPHFYRDREHLPDFLRRRKEACYKLLTAITALSEEERKMLPKLILGAEVAWVPNLAQLPELERLCYQDTKYLLLELPSAPWDDMLFRQIYDLMNCRGITPIIAHIDRYWGLQEKKQFETLFSLGVPVQLSAEPLLHFAMRGRALRLIRGGKVQMIISDAHNMTDRQPNLGKADDVLRKKLGMERFELFDFALSELS